MKYRINAITEWELDEYEMHADSGSLPDGRIARLQADEYEDKIEGGNWPGLPFECDADDEEEAVELYNDECCRGDYYKATEADIEELEDDDEHEEDEEGEEDTED